MKKIGLVLIVLLLPAVGFAQFKKQTRLPDFRKVLVSPTGSLFSFLQSDRLQMNHTFSVSYMNLGGRGLLVNAYMNTIDYQISDPLFLRINLGVLNTPLNSFSPNGNNTQFFGGADLYYRPGKNVMFHIGIQSQPGYFYYPRYSGYRPFDWNREENGARGR